MTIIWDFSSQEPVCVEEVGEAEGILKWGLLIPLRLGFLKNAPPGSTLRLALRSYNYSDLRASDQLVFSFYLDRDGLRSLHPSHLTNHIHSNLRAGVQHGFI